MDTNSAEKGFDDNASKEEHRCCACGSATTSCSSRTEGGRGASEDDDQLLQLSNKLKTLNKLRAQKLELRERIKKLRAKTKEKDLVEFDSGKCRKESEHTKLVESKAGQELYCRWRELKALVEGPLSHENIKKKSQENARLAESNEERENQLNKLKIHLQNRSLRQSNLSESFLQDCSMLYKASTNEVLNARWDSVLYIFGMYRLSISERSGIGKILGLPLPNSASLYSMLPKPALTTALRLVAGLTTHLARVLDFSLPHPIVCANFNKSKKDGEEYDKLIHRQEPTPRTPPFPIMSLRHKLKCAKAVVLLEQPTPDNSMKRAGIGNQRCFISQQQEYVLELPEDPNDYLLREEFGIGLQLLQHNVISLCMKIEVAPDDMHPAEALLMNLYECKRAAHSRRKSCEMT